MSKYDKMFKSFSHSTKILSWVLSLAVLLGSLPMTYLFALEETPASPAPVAVASLESSESAPASEEAPSSSLVSVSPSYAFRSIGSPSAVTLDQSDFVIIGDTIVRLTAAGETKVAAAKDIVLPFFPAVTKIGKDLFVNQKLESVDIAEGYEEIGSHAFQNMDLLEVALPSTLRTIGDYAFADNKLESFPELPDLQVLGAYGLYNNRLTEVKLSARTVGEKALAANLLEKVTLTHAQQLGAGAFFDNPKLEEIEVENAGLVGDSYLGLFNQEKKVAIFLPDGVSADSVTEDAHYVVNPITITITFKEKETLGELRETEIIKNKKTTDFPYTYDLVPIKNYRVDSDRVQNDQIVIDASEVNRYKVQIDLLFTPADRPQIIVGEKQFVFKPNKTLYLKDIVDSLRFIKSNGDEVPALNGNTLNAAIVLESEHFPSSTNYTLNAPNQETTRDVLVKFTDPDTNLTEEITLTFTYSDVTNEDEEIIQGQGWLYKDFRFSGNQLMGFSESGYARLENNKNVVLPGFDPATGTKVEGIYWSAFRSRNDLGADRTIVMDTVNFEKMDGLKYIRPYAFKDVGLSALLGFNKLLNLEEINDEAFGSSSKTAENRNRLTDVDFTGLKKLRFIGTSAFLNNEIETVTLEGLDALDAVGYHAFQSNNLKSVTLRNLPKLKELRAFAFRNNEGLKEFIVEDLPSLEYFGSYLVQNASLGDLVFKDLPKLNRFDNHAFANAKVSSVVFENLPELTNINDWSFERNLITEVTFKDLPKLKVLSGFYENRIKRLELKDLPELETLGTYVFRSNALEEDLILENLPKLKTINGNAFESMTTYGDKSSTGIDNLILRNLPLLETIGNNAFNNLGAKNIVLDELPLLKNINSVAFHNHRAQRIELANLESLVNIGWSAFKPANHELEEFVMKNLPNLEVIDNEATRSNNLKRFVGEASDVPKLRILGSYVGGHSLLTGTWDINRFPGLEEIRPAAFHQADFVELNLSNHDSIKYIRSNAFSGSEQQYTKVEIANDANLERIENEAFAEVGSQKMLRSVRIADNPKLKYLSGFKANDNLSSVELSNLPELEEIGYEAFFMRGHIAKNISSMDLTPFTKLKKIGERAFDGTALTKVELPASVETIGSEAYNRTLVSDINLAHVTSLKSIGDKAFNRYSSTPGTFVLPETAEPIELGRHIVALTPEQRDFSSTPNVKVKLTSTEPFVRSGSDTLVLRFDNDDQISWADTLRDANPDRPTIIYIDNVNNPDKIAHAPAGLLINPGKIKVRHVRAGTEDLMPGSKVEEKFLAIGTELSPVEFTGFKVKEATATPAGFATYDNASQKVTINSVPGSNDAMVTFHYEESDVIPADDYVITVERAGGQGDTFNYVDSFREIRVRYFLQNVDMASEQGVKLVVTLPPHAANDEARIQFPKTIPGQNVTKAYYNADSRQIVYEISQFKDTSPDISLRIGFQFDPLDTPRGIEEVVRAGYYLADGKRKGAEGVSEPFKPAFEDPRLGKTQKYDWHTDHVRSATPGSGNQYTDFELSYTFYPHAVRRRMSHLEIEDTLPTYKRMEADGSVVTVPAVFDPAKNPNWTLDPDGVTLRHTVTEETLNKSIRDNGHGYYQEGHWEAESLHRAATPLVLNFPRAVAQTNIRNTAKMTFHVKDPVDSEPATYVVTASRNDNLRFMPWINATDISKSGHNEYLAPLADDRTKDYNWTIRTNLAKKGKEFEGNRTYERTIYSDIEFWDYYLDKDDNIFEFNGFTSDQPLTIEVYPNLREPNNSRRMTEEEITRDFGAVLGTYTLVPSQRFYLPEDIAKQAKSIRFKYDGNIDSDTYETELTPEQKAKSSYIPFHINVTVHSRLGEGKRVPNVNRSRYNYSRLYTTAEAPDSNVPVEPETVVRGTWAPKNNVQANPQIEVTKSSEYGTSSTVRQYLRSETATVNFTLGFTGNWTNQYISAPWKAKNFRLVDIFPTELDFREDDITLNPEFVRLGGTYKASQHEKGTKLEFSAPTVPSNLGWVAKIASRVKQGTSGETEFDNRAYIYVDQNPELNIIHKNAEAIEEENGQSLTYAIRPFATAFNGSLTGNKFVRRVLGNGAWFSDIKTGPNELIEYKFEVNNNTVRDLRKLEFFDLFPAVDDHVAVQYPNGSKPARESAFANTLVPFEDGSLIKAQIVNIETKAVNAETLPVVLFSSLEGFPKSAQEGEVHTWIEEKSKDASFITNDAAEAKAIYIGGDRDKVLPKNTRLEVVIRMRTPAYAFENLDSWKNTTANNTVAYNYEGGRRFKESQVVSNTLVEPTKSIKIQKVDSVTKQPLENAVFTLSQEGEEDRVAQSDAEGWLYFPNIKYKTAYLREVTAPTGYKFDNDTRTLELNKDTYEADLAKGEAFKPDVFEAVDSLVIENELLPPPDPDNKEHFTLKLLKKDAQGQNLNLVKFKLENLGTGDVSEALTNAAGQISFNQLRAGQYRLSEVSNMKRYTFIEPVLFNLPLPEDFTSESVESITQETDEQDEDHKIYVFEIHNTRFRVDLLKLGVNRLKTAVEIEEEKADKAKVASGEMTQEAFLVKYAEKWSELDRESATNAGTKLAKVVFNLYETDKTADQVSELANAQATFLRTIETNDQGRVSIEGLKVNTLYKLQETATAATYALRDVPVYFYVDAEGAVKTASGDDYVRPDILLVSNLKATVKSSLTVTKVDDVTKQPLANARFRLLKLTTVNVGQPDQTEEYRPIENNIQTTTATGEAFFKDLEYGRYRLEEIEAPEGYIRSPERIDIVVQPYTSQNITRTVGNKKMKLRVEKVEYVAGPFSKQSDAQQSLEAQVNQDGLFVALENNQRFVYRRLKDAQFELRESFTDAQGVERTEVITPDKAAVPDTFTSYEFSTGLVDIGTYVLREVVAPKGYKEIAPVTIKLDRYISANQPEATVYVRNNKQEGSLYIAKFADRVHTVLPGAKFGLYKGTLTRDQLSEDKLVRYSDEEGGEYGISNSHGIVHYTALPTGDYTLVELESVKPYVIVEEPVHFSVTDEQPDHRFSFYNKLQKIDLKLIKQDDAGNPIANLAEASFDLIYDGNEEHPITAVVSQDEEGVLIFHNLPVVGDYVIREHKAPQHYIILGEGKLKFSSTVDKPLAENHTVTMKNKRQIQIVAEKQWVGGNVANRPNVFLKLLRKVEGGSFEEIDGVPLKPVGNTDGNADFGYFDAYSHDGDKAKPYIFTIEVVDENGDPVDLPSYNYEADPVVTTKTPATDKAPEVVTLKAVSRYISPKTKLTISKVWRNGREVAKPDFEFELWRTIDASVKATKVDTIERQDVPKSLNPVATVIKWLTGGLTADDLRVDDVVFNNVDVTNEDGVPYIYFVKEVSKGEDKILDNSSFKPEENDIKAAEGDADAKGIKPLTAAFVNKFEIPVGSIEATKTWIGGASSRPATHFYLRRGLDVNDRFDTEFVSEIVSLPASDRPSNQAIPLEWENLPLTDKDGRPYHYSVVEFDGTDRTNMNWTPENYTKRGGSGTVDKPLAIENTYVSPRRSFEINKVWQTADGELVPNAANFVLYRSTEALSATHTIADFSEVARIALDKATHTVNGNDKTWKLVTDTYEETDENGVPYHYELVEGAIAGYSADVAKKTENGQHVGFTATNSPVLLSKSVTKVWENPTNETNPAEVTVRLKRNGQDYRTQVLNTANGYAFTFENLPSHDGQGQEYVYTLTEDEVPAYTTAPVVENADGFVVTNTRNTTAFEVTKTWRDESSETAKPEKIVVRLYRNKAPGVTAYKEAEITAATNWTHTFDKLPTQDNAGNAYTYEVEEVAMTGYEASVNGGNILNVRELTHVVVNKTWEHEDPMYPNSVTYVLKVDKGDGNGPQVVNTITVNKPTDPDAAGSWNHDFLTDANGKKLPRYSPNGVEYTYTIEGGDAPGYTKTITKNTTDGSFTSYTIHNKQEMVDLKVEKRWIGGKKTKVDILIKRQSAAVAESLVATFEADPANAVKDGEENGKAIFVVSEEYRFAKQDAQGNEFTYTVKEVDAGRGYTSQVVPSTNGEKKVFTVINTFTSPQGNTTGEKLWDRLYKGQKVPYIKLVLYRRLRHQGIGEPVPNQPVYEFPAFVHNSTDTQLKLNLSWKDFDLMSSDGEDYYFHIVEFNEAGEMDAPKGFFNGYKELSGMKVINTFAGIPTGDDDGPRPTPPTPSPNPDPTPTPIPTPDKDKDRVPNTGAFSKGSH